MRPDDRFYDGLAAAILISFAVVWMPVIVGLYLRFR